MLRKFRIKINEKEYMVEMEELGVERGTPASAPLAGPVQAAASVQAPVPTSAPVPVRGEGDPVTAPMPGTILDIKVSVGDVVKENQVLAVLEAMKMENEIVAPRAGTITAIPAMKGAPIDVGKTIVVIK
ncbi:biotin/lipoyl attachment [Trichococcus palustris]|jgi:glutaconyl-CoA/methylmalonyl-CoA decarboxylase subunit gamma|uniref:Biotin/lipoyl attachment n=1 Tax=Trichococcus palustris TaxID=140314 RepID=A0A143Y8L6_9LACT|nr:biotin/lipoyl-containing protein [Trichococcus palustris]CZQ82491.1 biotin/lipoyl attachment [Trichococcus palustris]SFK67487.1 Biotin-requiring enzyme [Trichococcus palustris]